MMNEISTDRNIKVIEAEIKTLTYQANTMALQYIIEIGRRLAEAKGMLEHGQWGSWIENNVHYSQSSAENYIKIYKEYGGKQISFFGDLSNSQSLANLGVAKLIELTAVPTEEREAFVAENNITTDTTVKELQELLRKEKQRGDDAEAEIQRTQKAKESQIEALKMQLDEVKRTKSEKESEVKELRKRLEDMPETDTAPENELEKLRTEAENEAKRQVQDKIDKLEDKVKKMEDKSEALKSEIRVKEEEKERYRQKWDEASDEAKKLKTQIENSNNENMLKINLLFKQTQELILELMDAIEEIKGTDKYDKLKSAISQAIIGLAKQEERI